MYDQRVQERKEIEDMLNEKAVVNEKEINKQLRFLSEQNDAKNEDEMKRLRELQSKVSSNKSDILSLIDIFIYTFQDKDFVNEIMSQKIWSLGEREREY